MLSPSLTGTIIIMSLFCLNDLYLLLIFEFLNKIAALHGYHIAGEPRAERCRKGSICIENQSLKVV